MTKFDKSKFRQDAMFIHYENRFVARLKHQKSAIGSFIKFIRDNFTVEEYFARLDAGELPLNIVESKGYLHPTTRRFLRSKGYPDTAEGYSAYRKTIRNGIG